MTDAPSRRRRWLRRAVVLVVLLAVGAVVARLALPGLVRGWLTDTLAEQLNLDVTIEDVDVDLGAGHVTLSGVRCELDGELLATSSRVDAELDVAALLGGDGGTITLDVADLHGNLVRDADGALNLGRIGPRTRAPARDAKGSDQASATRILLDMHAPGAEIRFHDAVTEPDRPVDLDLRDVEIVATQILVSGPERGAPLTDVRLLGAVVQDVGPALLAAGFWEGLREDGRYLELHAALTALDVRTVPQYITPNAGTILGGDIVHVAATAVAHRGTIESGVIEVEVEDSSSDLELRFGGPLGAPVFDMDSPAFQAFRLSYLRVVDSGSDAFAAGASFGGSLWDRTAGAFSTTASGVGSAISNVSVARLGKALWDGVRHLFASGADDDERAARIELWAGYARRQIAFRELFLQRRLEVAQELEPDRVTEFRRLLEDRSWRHALDALVPEDHRAADDR